MVTFDKCTCGHVWNDDADAEQTAVCPVCGRALPADSTHSSRANGHASEATVTSDPSDGGPPRFSGPVPVIPGYRLEAELGRGGMGVVYRAYDLSLKRTVALKTLPRINPDSLRRFKQEFRSLADIHHPNVVKLFELFSDGQIWSFSMELIEGADFYSYVWDPEASSAADGAGAKAPFGTLQELRLRRGLAQLAEGLDCLHRGGFLHRDIKPSNVLVTSEERVVLLDFGLAAPLEETGMYETSGDSAVGTAHYMGPEQAMGGPVSPASDWYSTGVVLYQALTGRLPFAGTNLQVILDKRTAALPPPRDLMPSIPEDLDRLCMDLLNRDPAGRPDGADVLARLRVTETSSFRHRMMSAPLQDHRRLIGRQPHLERLEACLAETQAGISLTVFVHGRSGMGKSALVQEFLTRVRHDGRAVVLAGRCYEQESIPFKALDNVIDELARYLSSLPPQEAEVLMPRDWTVLTQLFPVLGRVKTTFAESRRGSAADEKELRRRGVRALRELLTRIGDRRPLLVNIDDLQWGDEDSAEVLAQLLEPPDPPTMMFVGVYRAEDAATSRFLATFCQAANRGGFRWNARELVVDPLSPEESKQLMQSLLHRENTLADSREGTIAAECGGSPFFICELTRYLASEADSDTLSQIDLNSVIWARISRLPAAARDLLETVAVAGRPVSLADCLNLASESAEPHAVVNDLRANHLLRTASSEEIVALEVYHDRIRETVVARLSSGQLNNHHRRLATMLLRSISVDCVALSRSVVQLRLWDRATELISVPDTQWQRIFDASRHLAAAGDMELALPFALTAAHLARSQYSLEAAAQHLTIAERGLAKATREQIFHVNASLGEVLMLLGRYAEARPCFERACDASHGDLAKAEMEGRLGELAFKQGDMIASSERLERALGLLGRWTPRSPAAFWLVLAWELCVQLLHSLCSRKLVARCTPPELGGELLAARLFGRLGHAYWFRRGAIPTLATHLRGLNLIECFQPTRELAQTYSEHAVAISVVPWLRRSLFYGRKSLQIRKDLGDLWGQGQSLHFLGIVYYAASRYEECLEHCREAIGLFQRTGDYWEVNMARYQVAASLYRLGHLQAAAEEAERMHRSGVQLGDRQAAGLGLDILSKARRGEIDPATIRRELDRPPGDDAQTRSQLLQAEGVRLLAAGEYSEAAEVFQRGYSVARSAGVCNTYVVPCLPWLATALRMQAEQVEAVEKWDWFRAETAKTLENQRSRRCLSQFFHSLVASISPVESRRLRKRAQAAASKGLRLARRFQNDLPHALRENAILATLAGRGKRARKLFDESLRVAERQKARYEHASTQIALGQAGQKFGWSDAEAALQEGTRVARQCESEP
jgi:eukaryotic-like serine/threonine-protein kinase